MSELPKKINYRGSRSGNLTPGNKKTDGEDSRPVVQFLLLTALALLMLGLIFYSLFAPPKGRRHVPNGTIIPVVYIEQTPMLPLIHK